jgi:hypothetical protein
VLEEGGGGGGGIPSSLIVSWDVLLSLGENGSGSGV